MIGYLGAAYAALGDAGKAGTTLAAARKAAGTDAERLNALCWMLATHDVALDTALNACDAALATKADEPAMIDSRAFVLLRLGRYAEALTAYDRAIRLRPTQAGSLYGRGLTKLRLGRTADGEADLAAARKADGRVAAEFQGYGITT